MIGTPEGIYFVTDPELTHQYHPLTVNAQKSSLAGPFALIEETASFCKKVVNGGVSIIQLRWKNCDSQFFLALAGAVSEIVHDEITLIINDRIDVFLAARAKGIKVDGVHIGQTDLDPYVTRKLVGSKAIIGLSASSPSEIQACTELKGVIDYVGIGVVRNTTTKPDAPPPLGISGIASIASRLPIPVTAIGGITESDISSIAQTSIHNAAIISDIIRARNPELKTAFMANTWKNIRGLS
ncbi:thiamine phosphate synthase [Arcanobacterium ihumii]|uniref:thiamine phosphate synthase n=1 Tax=Arcanobacterium ihumii TaxID=2138162 RepID=UPI000F526A01|nr:thiamine phosphate synthase [Arcanobacterium ihumii]